MKIGIISDTHLAEADSGLCRVAAEVFKDVSLILHAGDLTHMGVLDAFGEKRCIAVRGNMDRGEAADRLPYKRVVATAGKRIGLIHGGGSPIGIEKRVMSAFSGVDAVIFGHTHKPLCRWTGGVLLFNPGAYCGTFILKRKRSVGILTVGDPLSAEHIAIG